MLSKGATSHAAATGLGAAEARHVEHLRGLAQQSGPSDRGVGWTSLNSACSQQAIRGGMHAPRTAGLGGHGRPRGPSGSPTFIVYGEAMAHLSSEGTLTAFGSVGYPNGLTWIHQWFRTSQYLGRLRQVYSAAPANNVDLIAVVDAFMISCAHMWDAFKNDPGLTSIGKTDVEAAMKGDASLRLCRDYANTAKHLKRRSSGDIVAAVIEAGTKGTGNFVTIGYGSGANPRQATIDALQLADSAYGAWQRFMQDHGIEDPKNVTAMLLAPPEGG